MPSDKVSLEEIRKGLAAAGDPWEAGVTSMSVLSPEEQIARLGVRPPPGESTSRMMALVSSSLLAARICLRVAVTMSSV